jgi:hypothetical protein
VQTLKLKDVEKFFKNKQLKYVKVIEKPTEVGAGSENKGTLIPTIHPVTGPEEIVAAPWWIDKNRAPLRKSAPVLGEGNDYVLGFLLNWSPEDRALIMAFDQEKRHDKKN